MRRVALVLLLAVPAHADTWKTEDKEQERRNDEYQKHLSDGDEAATLAASESSSPSRLEKLVQEAARDYELAADARPDLAEPHYRAANVLYGFYIDCAAGYDAICIGEDNASPELRRRIIGHWDAMEKIDPLDPRLGAGRFDLGIRFARAIEHTWLADDDDLRLAIADYLAVLDEVQHSGAVTVDLNLPLGNLAESYMMLGDVDKAIPYYKEALESSSETSEYYGLAVAYDREGEGGKARQIMKDLGEDAYTGWEQRVVAQEIFYVPEGEVYYYRALAAEAFDHLADAETYWLDFIESGAHPQFDDRARENLKAVQAKLKAKK